MRTYTTKGYVLGSRCDRGHGGNRRLVVLAGHHPPLAECQGCGWSRAPALFVSRVEAMRVEREETR